MNAYAFWILFMAVIYTAVLIIAGNVAKSKAARGEDFWVGGRCFKPWMVAVCITGLFSGSSYIAILELSYTTGISAGWYGVAEMLHVLIIALFFVVPFRKRLVVTISGLIGDRYGRQAKAIAGAITAITFPMYATANALAFAAAMSAFTGISPSTWVIFSALLLLVYLQAGGMWSVVFTQTANVVAFTLMFIIGLAAFFIKPGFAGLAQLAVAKPAMFGLTTVGLQTILAWFGTFLVNVFLAQAAFQMALSCRTPEEGQKGLLWAAGFNVIFIVLGVLFGMAAAVAAPGLGRGLVAVPQYLAGVLPAPLVGIFFMGIWACALGWGAPCQFSGATSLGRDVVSSLNPRVTDRQMVTYTKWSLVVLTLLMIVFGFLRTEQAAWWNVLAWTVRNGATFAPIIGVLFWPLATRKAAVSALIAGFVSGIAWYHLGAWNPAKFYLNIHPVWIGMIFNVSALTLVTLIERAGSYRWVIPREGAAKNVGRGAIITGLVLSILAVIRFNWLYTKGVFGMILFLIFIAAFCMVIAFTREAAEAKLVQEKSHLKGTRTREEPVG
ncbi:sodium:solute symporter family protein [Moorella naiadis]|uniref:sodium:solute symporter family protein n=1 Tax=Moorella naiadis (nom. illeg.) TaxID=3093670 RepID=UPI003D9CAB7B